MTKFWALVATSQRLRKNKNFRTTPWWKLYILFFGSMAAAGYLLLVYRGQVNPFIFLLAVPYLLLIIFLLSMNSVRQEWRSQTVGWWLSLPYPRAELLWAKMAANFFRFLKISGGALGISAILLTAGSLINPGGWSVDLLYTVAADALKLYLMALGLAPAVIAGGIFLAVLLHSRLKPLTLLVWIAVISPLITFFNSVFATFAGLLHIPGLRQLPPPTPAMIITVGFIVPLLIAVMLFAVSTYVLAKHVEI